MRSEKQQARSTRATTKRPQAKTSAAKTGSAKDGLLPPGVHLSIHQASEEFGCDRGALTRKVQERSLAASGLRAGRPVYRLRDLLYAHLLTAEGKADPNKMTPFERQAHFKAISEQMRIETESGSLLRRDDVEVEWARVLKVIGQELDTIVDEVERDIGTAPDVLEKIEVKIDTIRTRMHAAITEGAAG